MINTKTIARIAAVQGLYQYQLLDQQKSAQEIILEIREHYRETFKKDYKENVKDHVSMHRKFFAFLVAATIENILEIDASFAEYIKGPTSDCAIAILRVAVSELKYSSISPHKVVIDEFTSIANSILSNQEIGFINFTLDKVAKKVYGF